ncbi:MAG: hypothetical protein WBE37_23965 [Bryobacteraceae bacterium]
MLSVLRKAALFLIVPIFVFAIYDVPIFYSRWRYTRNEERAGRAIEAQQAGRTIAMLGGGELKILNFYGPNAVRRGEHGMICYGVYGAKSVRIEPPVEKLQPALAHCLQVSPAVTTEYKLVAQDGTGHTTTKELTIQVRR